MKTRILALMFLTACSWNNSQSSKKFLFNPFSFLGNSWSCEKTHKKLSERNRMSKKEKKQWVNGAEDCLKKNKIELAVFIFEKLLRESKTPRGSLKEIKKWEKTLANLAFYKVKNYEKALKYYILLLTRPLEPGEKFFIQLNVAESFFHLKKYSQALREVEKCFFKGLSIEQKKQALVLKGRIFIAEKQFKKAVELFEKQIVEFPEEENFFREYLALIYEGQKDFLSAIKELEKIQPPRSFVQQKIRRLIERQNNQPGF